MADYEVHHEIVASNQDVDVRFYLSVDQGSYVAPHWHNSLEIIYMLEGSMHVKMEDREKEVQAGAGNFSGKIYTGLCSDAFSYRSQPKTPDRDYETGMAEKGML